jgi:thiosulfate/3-mercaptopyruvate sulfurtransferase
MLPPAVDAMTDPVLPAEELAALTDVVLLDCRPDPAAYRAGHLPGARHVREHDLAAPTDEPARGGRHPLPSAPDLAATLGRWGITPGSRVVAYDDRNGAIAAARMWWMLDAMGHRDVQVVDGGLPALRAAEFPLTTEEPAVTGRPPYPQTELAHGCAEIDEVERARGAGDRCLIDTRAAFRYRGESDPFETIAGHIPGARNVPYAENLRADGTFKSAVELRRLYSAVLNGVAPAQAIVYCASGVTACHTLLAMRRAGLHGAKLYVGSWSEWSRHPERARAPARS